MARRNVRAPGLEKCPTGITGLDEITEGGIPRGRPTLVCGGPGCGKTLLGMEFIVRGIGQFGEPGVFISFEETENELAENVASLGFDINSLIRQNKLAIDHVHLERSEIEETGEFDLQGLFIRLGNQIDHVGARRIVLDSIESLFSGLPNEAILRSELRRLFRWLKEKQVTAVITGEQGGTTLTRYGIEEYISDCVIFLDHRVVDQIATRRLRVVKYRGSRHGTNEYPTFIDEDGLSVLPISVVGLDYRVSRERVSSGIARLDTMLGGKGYYRGSSVLVSGTAGTGKTSIATAFVDGMCSRGHKCMYVAFEESPEQIIRNMQSIGYDLSKWVKKGLLRFQAQRPTLYGLETHLATIHKGLREFKPEGLVMDPVTNLTSVGSSSDIKAMLTRAIDVLKTEGVTALFTSLTTGPDLEHTDVAVSSLMDTWLLVRMLDTNGERNRLLYVLKSRGMPHSNQVREFQLSEKGIRLLDVYLGSGTVLTGTSRLTQEARDRAQACEEEQAFERRQQELRQERASLQAQAEAIAARLASIRSEQQIARERNSDRQETTVRARRELAAARKAD